MQKYFILFTSYFLFLNFYYGNKQPLLYLRGFCGHFSWEFKNFGAFFLYSVNRKSFNFHLIFSKLLRRGAILAKIFCLCVFKER